MVESIIRKCDLNNDGFIDFQEFVQAAIDHSEMLNEENIKIIFTTTQDVLNLEAVKQYLWTAEADTRMMPKTIIY